MMENPYAGFPDGFFARDDETSDARFYEQPRLVTHIDEGAIAAVGQLYRDLEINGTVLDLMSSWVSHFDPTPAELVVLGMNEFELDNNVAASERLVCDLNQNPTIPLDDESVDDVVCCVSVDYLSKPIEVFRDVGRVLRPGGRFVCTFSNRLFPTKAIHGWLAYPQDGRPDIVSAYFGRSGCFEDSTVELRTPERHRGDPLWGVWATRR